ncbi:hypothetical protein, partial [Pandoraea nosoerga]|uniref:hypothetical protein n=1 Tax=Pandoraea nosoerga TaxID=2508296 RepID=UPI0019811856
AVAAAVAPAVVAAEAAPVAALAAALARGRAVAVWAPAAPVVSVSEAQRAAMGLPRSAVPQVSVAAGAAR